MRLWKPVLIANSRLGSKEQHQYTTGTSAFSNYSVESRSAPQYYNCNFCEREFRSAQALGGHMNVHRRDRALLRFSSNSTSSTFLPPDDIPLISRKPDNSLHDKGLGCLPQQPHSPLFTSHDNNRRRSSTPSPFFHFFDNSSPKLGSNCQTPYSKEADIYWFRSNVVYSNRFELNKEEPPSPSNPLSVIRSGGIVDLRRKMRWEAAPIEDAPSNGGLDLELRLGNTS